MRKKKNLKCAFLHIFFNNTIDITLPSPNKARYVSINTHVSSSNALQTLWALFNITGGQRDFVWFPQFDKKTTFSLIPLISLCGSLTCRIQSNITFIELTVKLSSRTCRKKRGGTPPLLHYCCSQSFLKHFSL